MTEIKSSELKRRSQSFSDIDREIKDAKYLGNSEVKVKIEVPKQTIEGMIELGKKSIQLLESGHGDISEIRFVKEALKLNQITFDSDLPEEALTLDDDVLEKLLKVDRPDLIPEGKRIGTFSWFIQGMGGSDLELLAEVDTFTIYSYKKNRWQFYNRESGTTRMAVDDSRRKILKDIDEAGRFRKFNNDSEHYNKDLYIPEDEKVEELLWLMERGKVKGYDEVRVIRNADGIDGYYTKALARNIDS